MTISTRKRAETNLWDGDGKRAGRRVGMEGIAPVSNALFLPGSEQECLKYAYKIGLFKRGANVLTAELNRKTTKKIDAFMKKDMSKLNHMPLPKARLEDNTLPVVLDYAFIDLLGSISDKMALWILNELAPNLSFDSTVSFTLFYAWGRNKHQNTFMNVIHDVIKIHYLPLYEEVRSRLGIKEGKGEQYIVIQYIVLLVCFRGYSMIPSCALKYKDNKNAMVLIRFNHITKRAVPPNDPLPTLAELMSHLNKGNTIMKKDRSAAAVQANITRKANKAKAEAEAKKLAAKRSAAAVQANITRKANKLFAQRSIAAKKAWKTRRANSG